MLTSIGERHMRQRKLLLPAFHGAAVARYSEMIAAAADREIDSWPTGTPFALAPRMQAITLDVIMAGIFGVEGAPAKGTPEHRLRQDTGGHQFLCSDLVEDAAWEQLRKPSATLLVAIDWRCSQAKQINAALPLAQLG